MMKRLRLDWRAWQVVLVVGLVGPVLAQAPAPATTAHHSLWKVEGKGNTLYLMGSVHVLKPENYPLPAAMEAAYTNAATVVFETDIGALEDFQTQAKLLSRGQLPEGQTLADQLSPAVYAQFTNHLAETGMPSFIFDQMKPSLAAMTLVVVEMQKTGLDPEYGLDQHFYHLARKQHKAVAGLETADFQISMATDFSKEEGELLMTTTLKEIDNTKKELGELVQAWATGDGDRLEKLLNDASREAPTIFKRLLTDRNQRWVPKLEEWLGSGKPVLVVVGAGHLVGKEGVVELLRKRGYKVTQL